MGHRTQSPLRVTGPLESSPRLLDSVGTAVCKPELVGKFNYAFGRCTDSRGSRSGTCFPRDAASGGFGTRRCHHAAGGPRPPWRPMSNADPDASFPANSSRRLRQSRADQRVQEAPRGGEGGPRGREGRTARESGSAPQTRASRRHNRVGTRAEPLPRPALLTAGTARRSAQPGKKLLHPCFFPPLNLRAKNVPTAFDKSCFPRRGLRETGSPEPANTARLPWLSSPRLKQGLGKTE